MDHLDGYASNSKEDLLKTDKIASQVLKNIMKTSPDDIKLQMNDNINWINDADKNNLVVGSQARYYMLILLVELNCKGF